MFAILPWIASILSATIGFIIKHPLVLKMMFFPFFVSILMYAVTFLADFVSPYIIGNSSMALAAYFGVFDALALFLSILIAGFLIRSVLRYIS